MGPQHLLKLKIFLAPWVAAITIASTRIHRGLVDYVSIECTEQYDTTVPSFCALHINVADCSIPATVNRIVAQNGKPIEFPSRALS